MKNFLQMVRGGRDDRPMPPPIKFPEPPQKFSVKLDYQGAVTSEQAERIAIEIIQAAHIARLQNAAIEQPSPPAPPAK